jgi:hypothetical protein
MQEESARISFWASSMHRRQLELLLRRFKQDNNHIDKLFASRSNVHIFPGVLEDLRDILESAHRKGIKSVLYSLALTWIHVEPMDLNKAHEYLCLITEDCIHYEKAQIKLAGMEVGKEIMERNAAIGPALY